MTRLLCLLSGSAPPTTTVKHYRMPSGSRLEIKQEMGPAECLVIEAEPGKPETGALLYRFDGSGECVGDTWHRSVDEAKGSAAAEYAGMAQDWQEIPEGVDISAFSAALRAKN